MLLPNKELGIGKTEGLAWLYIYFVSSVFSCSESINKYFVPVPQVKNVTLLMATPSKMCMKLS